MVTKQHKMLVDLVARKMHEKGYSIVAVEGRLLPIREDEKLPIPWTIKHHRPDVIGINISTKRVCIGEAKTAIDLSSKRTAAQFADFANVVGKSGEIAELVIGVPLRSEQTLLHLLDKLRVPTQQTSIIILPEELAENDGEEDF